MPKADLWVIFAILSTVIGYCAKIYFTLSLLLQFMFGLYIILLINTHVNKRESVTHESNMHVHKIDKMNVHVTHEKEKRSIYLWKLFSDKLTWSILFWWWWLAMGCGCMFALRARFVCCSFNWIICQLLICLWFFIVCSFQQNLVAYQNLITQSMYDKQLDSGRGTLLHLCDDVIQQEVSCKLDKLVFFCELLMYLTDTYGELILDPLEYSLILMVACTYVHSYVWVWTQLEGIVLGFMSYLIFFNLTLDLWGLPCE